MGRILPRDFYDRDTETVSRELLGAVLETETEHGRTTGIIVETEAYLGEHDPACHAVVGRTRRTNPLYGKPGIAYVYFIYGVHWCFNAVTRREGLPSAVLVRAVEPLEGEELMRMRRGPKPREVDLTNGPGKLCAALGIDGAMNGLPVQRRPIVIREGEPVAKELIETTPRIGITRAADWPLRYLLRGNQWVSRAPKTRKPASSE
ncbi:MAG TPA: DNA-3-methyladenine glycosylase [Gemmatimonadaceae bacterium]|nr:DNA-3-methyladenine glycosylase [Gemmatimonadaceae bacterium]